jgi:ATP/ADP translocase/HEAT repeat protein
VPFAATIEEAQIPFRLKSTLTRRLGVEPEEQATLFLMGVLVATLLCAYTLAKVVRDALFLANFGALSLPYAYIAVAVASVGFLWLEARLTRRFPRLNLARFNQLLAIGFGLTAALVYPFSRNLTTAAFYLWTGSQAMLLIPHFWVLALDVWDSHRARRLFPVLSGCGLVGGLLGGGIAGWLTPVVKRVGLIWIVAVLFIVAHALTRMIEKRRKRRESPLEFATSLSRWDILRQSRYLKLLATALALSVVIGTLIDFQFKFFIQRTYPDPHQLTQFLGKFQVAMSAFALILQFGAVGWLLHRLGLTAASQIQPLSVMGSAAWVAMTGSWWAVVAMRWVQGVVLQTMGKSTTEIYYMAVPPPERRRVKPAIDTLVERWSDALVGVLLIALLHAVGVGLPTLVGVTIGFAAVWLVVLGFLNREYGRAFQTALSQRWIEPESAAESFRTPAARRALIASLKSDDERRLVLALRLAAEVRDRRVARAVREALQHPSYAVRAAAVQTMEALRLRDVGGNIERFVNEPDEALSSAAIRYLITTSRNPTTFVRRLVQGEDRALRRRAVDALFERPDTAPGALTLDWVDSLVASGTTEDLILAARALGAMPGSTARARLKALLADPDVEVKRAALLSAARRPAAQLLDTVLPLLFVAELSTEARAALAAMGDVSIPELARFLSGEHSARAQALAARALAEIASPSAVDALMTLVRSSDPGLRALGLRSLSHIRVATGRPILPRALAHKLFLREVRGYRSWIDPALQLGNSPEKEVRLLAESYAEFAEAALERAMRALACWYDPKPLSGAFERLKSTNLDEVAPALEHLSHILPGNLSRLVGDLFESRLIQDPDADVPAPIPIAEAIRSAWQSGDAWLRACAVRASRLVPEVVPEWFVGGPPSPIVDAELAARFPGGGSLAVAHGVPAAPREGPC